MQVRGRRLLKTGCGALLWAGSLLAGQGQPAGDASTVWQSPLTAMNWTGSPSPVRAVAGPASPSLAGETDKGRGHGSWEDYRTILWMGDSVRKRPDKLPALIQQLHQMGINTAMVYDGEDPQPWVAQAFPYYVENLVNRGLCLKWNSKVRNWEKFITDWMSAGRPETAFVREYCLDDPAWRSWARQQVQAAVRRNAPHRPLAYNLRDELSVTISANPFDYDFHPLALARFRRWLKEQYRRGVGQPSLWPLPPVDTTEGDRKPDAQADAAALQALNAQWQTQFASWDEVKPFSTDQIKHRMATGQARPAGSPDWRALQRLQFEPAAARREPTRWNFSPWCDFRTYMDLSLADALAMLREAAHQLDPHTPVGIEGTQMPHAFGGYDLWRLAQVLDWVEPYDIGNSREIFGSFMPGRPIVCTVFERDTHLARRRLWHLLLEGDRGCIVWWSEDCLDWTSGQPALTPKAQALAPVLKELTSPLARLFLRAVKQLDPIAIHYSQPSIQVDWLLESTVDGATWPRRFSSYEARHNRMTRVREAWLKALQDLGYSPVFVASEQVARGELASRRVRVFVMPQSLALSPAEADQIRALVSSTASDQAGPRLLLCDGTPGLFDQHGRLRSRSPLEDLFPLAWSADRSYAVSAALGTASRQGDIAQYARGRLAIEPDLGWARWLGELLEKLPPEVQVPLETRTRVHRFKLGRARLYAFERNISYLMSEELAQAGGNQALEVPVQVEAKLAAPAHLYDLRTGAYSGRTDRLRFTLDPWQPSLFAALPQQVQTPDLIGFLEKQGAQP